MQTPVKKIIPKRYKNLNEQIIETKAKSIMEIGIFKGAHAQEMIETAQRFNLTRVHYCGFDLFEGYTEEVKAVEGYKTGTPIMAEVLQRLKKTGAKVQLFKGFTRDTLPNFVNEYGLIFDVVFIDGGHSVDTIALDWFWVQKCVHKQSVILFDDYWEGRTDFGCKTLIDNLDRNLFKVEILSPQDVFPDKKINIVKVTFA